ncbi:hypothetical protein HELRODRAFT_174769 [Helobdella robusta]|uniref:Adipose-secreted signaling protein n=1 Tax=Helobdella robusta TaxID=6412 RepID=T1F8G1_HELRO|nr:hypothetical protein HELRODRAFT_174769 [Helobdella robusta]ESO01224.1 hypothetical protein HELRODRAFT_174769 [Helobdella robusta]
MAESKSDVSESINQAGRCNRVHFPAEQLDRHDSRIIVNGDADCKCLDVHLGFLQLLHDYHINFRIPDKLGKDLVCDPLQNLNVQLLEAVPTDNGHELLLSFKAQKEKLMKEELIINSATDSDAHIKLILHARVLGKGKGTPALRSGVHCIKVHADDEDSHLSDWQGFD